jgi:hypothetical protein
MVKKVRKSQRRNRHMNNKSRRKRIIRGGGVIQMKK